jgi:hypothetical protein
VNEQAQTYRVRFEGLSTAEANRAALELKDAIDRRGGASLQTAITKERDDTQDFGATLVVILGTPAVVTLAKAVHSYIAKRGDRVVIENENGTVIATGAAAKNIDVSETVAAMRAAGDGS